MLTETGETTQRFKRENFQKNLKFFVVKIDFTNLTMCKLNKVSLCLLSALGYNLLIVVPLHYSSEEKKEINATGESVTHLKKQRRIKRIIRVHFSAQISVPYFFCH